MTLGTLVCGPPASACAADATLSLLKHSIDRFSSKAITYLNGDFTEEAASFGAFCARVTLENACAALVGRLDPFRMIYLAEFQTQGGFEYGKQARSGFRWTGDILSQDKPPADLWSSDHDVNKISRALFSPYADHIYWKPAAESALDFAANHATDHTNDLKAIDPDTFIASIRGKCSELYSKLSKDVHWEFFSSSVVMDEGTVRDSIRDCLVNMSNIGFVSHFIPTAYKPLAAQNALSLYSELRGSFR